MLASCHCAGEAKSDFDIFIEYAHRMGFKDKDGEPIIKFSTPEAAFEEWKQLASGKLTVCDYSGITYDKLRSRSGMPMSSFKGAH